MEAPEIASPRIFAPSTFTIDDSQLCFSKTHFCRPDFNVQRFMNLARRRAGLDQIQKDLRLYLKSLQHSMIELINDDYADFVHLSSNLVCLHSNIEKIDKDIKGNWTEFETSTKEAVEIAEKVEIRCEQLIANRSAQSVLRNRIAFLSSLHRLHNLLTKSSDLTTMLWLEKISSCIVDITTYDEECLTDREQNSRKIVLEKLEKKLSEEGVKSLGSDCTTFPLVLSVLTAIKSTDIFTSALVADFLYPQLVQDQSDLYSSMMHVYKGVNKMRQNWSSALKQKFTGSLALFLDQSLLTFIQIFIDKKLGRVAVPSDTRLFHKCYLATQEFISEWPSATSCRLLLKGIRDKFNLVVYFKLETHKFTRKLDSELSPENIAFVADHEDGCPRFAASNTTVQAVETVWDEEVYLPPLIDKLWEFTLRMASKHYGWVKTMYQSIVVDNSVSVEGTENWLLLLYVRSDASLVHNKVFDIALEQIWTKLRDLNVDTSLFGQCLTKLGTLVNAECAKFDKAISNEVTGNVQKVLDSVCDIPKQYRWTRKPLPTSHSAYLNDAFQLIEYVSENLEKAEYEEKDTLVLNLKTNSIAYFATKAKEVLDGVEATGSSLSRFKRKGAAQEGVSDDDKIRAQIHCDVRYALETASLLEIDCSELNTLLSRSQIDTTERSQTPEVQPTVNHVNIPEDDTDEI